MRLAAIFLGLLLATGSAWAEWEPVFFTYDGDTNYIDPATIRKEGSLRKVWEILDLKQRHKDGEMSRRSRSEYDCKNERRRFMSISEHSEPMARGETLRSVTNTSGWYDIPPVQREKPSSKSSVPNNPC